MELPQEAYDNSVLIVAHPGDEVLWFSSILDAVTCIVIVFVGAAHHPGRGDAQRAAIAEHRYRNKIVSLEIERHCLQDTSDWPGAEVSAALAAHLSEVRNIFTHNPWGEHGHDDHVQLSKVATQTAADVGASIWYDNYVSGESSHLMRQYFGAFAADYCTMDVDAAQAREIAASYMKNGAWTFEDDYAWFPSECFVKGPLERHAEPAKGILFPVNYIRVPFDPVGAGTPSPGFIRRALRKLKSVTGHAATD